MSYLKEDKTLETESEPFNSHDKGGLKQEEKVEMVKKGTPAEQANQTGKQIKKVWEGFLLPEKMIVIAALVGIVSFFLPWISIPFGSVSGIRVAGNSGWIYLYPLLMLASLGLIYFTQGASKITKILTARWQILIGSIFAFKGIVGIVAIQTIMRTLGSFVGPFGGRGFALDINVGIGWWLLTLSALAILIGAFKLQKELLAKD